MVEAKSSWSPNGFPVGYCTWYVDGKTNANGWLLKFSKKGNAYEWWSQVSNATQQGSNGGNAGDIMVLDKGSFSSVGHVAFVTSSGIYSKTGTRAWTVRHANWTYPTGQTAVEKIDGYSITQCTFVLTKDGKSVQIIYDEKRNVLSSPYPLKGFLHKKK